MRHVSLLLVWGREVTVTVGVLRAPALCSHLHASSPSTCVQQPFGDTLWLMHFTGVDTEVTPLVKEPRSACRQPGVIQIPSPRGAVMAGKEGGSRGGQFHMHVPVSFPSPK